MEFVKNAIAVPIDITPELKVKIRRVSEKFIDSCKDNGLSSIEAYVALSYLTSSLEHCVGGEIHGAIHISDEDLKSQS